MSQNKEAVEALYDAMSTPTGRAKLGDDPLSQEKALETMAAFLDEVPKRKPWSQRPKAPLLELPLGEIMRRTLQTAVDVLNDLSRVLTDRQFMSNASFRRKVFAIFTAPERRLYVGVWLIVLAFFLYFIDASA